MPLLKNAKKKLRQDKKRTEANSSFKEFFRGLIKKARKEPTAESVRTAVQIVDKAAKKNIIHKNKAARIKSSLSKMLDAGTGTKTVHAASAKKAEPKVKAPKAASKKATGKTSKKASPKKK